MKKINIYSFCDNSKSSIRPILKGAYCKDGFITATWIYTYQIISFIQIILAYMEKMMMEKWVCLYK